MKFNLDEAIVCIVGLGYVGSPLAAAFAKSLRVIGFDVDGDKIRKLNQNNANQNLTFTNKDAVIGLLGLAFKPGTDDVRDSRTIKIVEVLLREGAIVKAYDPLAVKNFGKLFPQIEYVTKEEVLNSDAILIVTEWEEFNHLDYKGKIVIDGRRIAKAREARIYEGVCW